MGEEEEFVTFVPADTIRAGDEMLFYDKGEEISVEVIGKDDTLKPPTIMIRLPDGQMRATEASRLSRAKKRRDRQISPSIVQTVSSHE